MAITVSAASKALISASIPAVAKAGPTLTSAFYSRMFKNHPELMSTFNLAHQRSGDQPRALFQSIVYAAQSALSDGKAAIPGPAVACIAHKHCSLDISGPQYDVVGANLLATIKEELGVGQDILDAWGELYGGVAGALIATEAALYEQSAQRGGWKGKKAHKIVRREKLADNIVEIELAAADGSKAPAFAHGQYVSVWPTAKQLGGEWAQPRQYSLISRPEADTLIISVRRVDGGMVSPWLHSAEIGTEVDVTAPFGPLEVPANASKYVFVSSGIGITGNLGVLRGLVYATGRAPMHWVYGCPNGKAHPFRSSLIELEKEAPWLHRHVFYSDPLPSDEKGSHYHYEGPVDMKKVAPELGDLSEAQVVLTGFGDGLAQAREDAMAAGAQPQNIQVELFGSGLNTLARPE